MCRFVIYLLFAWLLVSCNDDHELAMFQPLSYAKSGLDFVNSLEDTPDFNIMEYLYYYNGGGVAAGDINNDGLVDLFFSGNQVNDRLYINQGDLTFKDISESSGINIKNGWSTGASMIDINADGLLDIYVCRLGDYKIYDDHNRLYINQGDNTFLEMSEEYGLHFSGFSTHANFFDFDRDGDLDCYLLNHSVKRPNQFLRAEQSRNLKDSLAGDRLYENQGGIFKDVTQKSGILSSPVGFGLSVCTADINDDGWLDIYVGNDFHENDYLYINNKNGTFSDVSNSALAHSSNFTMGATIADINSDGLMDIFTLDMQPSDEEIYKQSGGWENMEIYSFKRSYGYHHQSPRNVMQLNLGMRDSVPIFSDHAGMNGLHATDWSWSPLISDFDLDGDMDIYITNGIVKRPNDMDFVNYMSDTNLSDVGYRSFIQSMGDGHVANVYFDNRGDDFKRYTIGNKTASNGACLADLDNDGDFDIVESNIGANCTVLINQTNPEDYVKIKLRDTTQNSYGLGASLSMKYVGDTNDTVVMSYNISSTSGFVSMSEASVIFPKEKSTQKLYIKWADGHGSFVELSDDTKNVLIDETSKFPLVPNTQKAANELERVGKMHIDAPFNDQNLDVLVPYKRSNINPQMSISNNGEVYVSQGKGNNGYILDTDDMTIVAIIDKQFDTNMVDETGSVFFDADGDGDQDLYICIGGMELEGGNPSLYDRLYINDNGFYTYHPEKLPLIGQNTSVVSPYDYDQDGDTDLFVGVQGVAHNYGVGEDSYLLENIDNIKFKAKALDLPNQVYDAQWADMNNDGVKDLILAGHWMPITILYNNSGSFVKEELPNSNGLWFSVFISDVDGDGMTDILAGNFGENHRITVDPSHPLKLLVADYDRNNKQDPIITYFKDGKEYPYANLDLLLKQLPGKKKLFRSYKQYSDKNIKEILLPSELKKANVLKVETLASTWFRQQNGTWESVELPRSLQLASIWSFANWKNGYVVGGNLYDVDPNWGRQDALPLSYFRYEDGLFVNNNEVPLYMSEIRSMVTIDSILLVASRDKQLKLIHE